MTSGKRGWFVLSGVAAFALAATVALAGTAVARHEAGQPGMHGEGFGRGGPFGFEEGHLVHVLQQLDLSDDQKARLREQLLAAGPVMQPLIEQSMEAHRGLAEAIHADAFDAKAVRKAADAWGTAEANLAVERARLFSSLRQDILTDDQKQTLEQMKERMHDHIDQRASKMQAGAQDRWAEHVNALVDGL